jgi:NAD(P)H dehydrogenase (quinone)
MTDTTELFLITGATGKTGVPTVALLRERGFRVRAFVHTLNDRATRLQKRIAAILANPEPHDRQIYPLYGPEELDHHAIAQKMAQTLGISVRYEPVDIESFAAAMRAQGASPFLAQYLSNVARDYQNSGVFAGTNNLVEAIGGTPPMTVEQYTTATRAAYESDGQYAAWASVA